MIDHMPKRLWAWLRSIHVSVYPLLGTYMYMYNLPFTAINECSAYWYFSHYSLPTAATIEYEAELRHKNEMARVEAEIKGK